MSPSFFIDRPIFASVISIVIVVIGLVAMQVLPIAQFPEITPPVVQIDADYPGASAEVIAESVARPIEVRPTSSGPSHRKCFCHLWRRG